VIAFVALVALLPNMPSNMKSAALAATESFAAPLQPA
jgi:hypothetical protein